MSSPGTTDTGGAGSSGSSGSRPRCTSNDFPVVFAPDVYSAYIPGSTHVFQVPAMAAGGPMTPVVWTASDPSMVEIDPGLDGFVMFTMKNAGTVSITASSGGRCGTISLHITAATEEQWSLGNARYNNMNPLPNIPTDAGVPNVRAVELDPPAMPPACTNCHGPTATSGVFETITYTPQQTGGYSDAELVAIFTKGWLSENGFIDRVISSTVFRDMHSWSDIGGDAAQGMVVYLRSISPRSVSQIGGGPP